MRYYVYLLLSEKDNRFYVGYSSNVERRFKEHCEGRVCSTKFRCPLNLIYYECYNNESKAKEREGKLKQFGAAFQALLKRIGYR